MPVTWLRVAVCVCECDICLGKLSGEGCWGIRYKRMCEVCEDIACYTLSSLSFLTWLQPEQHRSSHTRHACTFTLFLFVFVVFSNNCISRTSENKKSWVDLCGSCSRACCGSGWSFTVGNCFSRWQKNIQLPSWVVVREFKQLIFPFLSRIVTVIWWSPLTTLIQKRDRVKNSSKSIECKLLF